MGLRHLVIHVTNIYRALCGRHCPRYGEHRMKHRLWPHEADILIIIIIIILLSPYAF